MYRKLLNKALVLLCAILSNNLYADDSVAFKDIIESATDFNTTNDHRPLPLASHWNLGEVSASFGPDYQLELLKSGRRILPWLYLPSPINKKLDDKYYYYFINYLKDNKLPFSLVSTQWEHLLTDEVKYFNKKPEENPNEITLLNVIDKKVSPFSPSGDWYNVGYEWTTQSIVRKLQKWYSDPPLVLFLSNNEHSKLSISEVYKSKRYFEKKIILKDDEALKKYVSDQWVEKYTLLIKGMRNGLSFNYPDSAWNRNSKFVGYNAFHWLAFGSDPGWQKVSLYTPGRLNPLVEAWDGASLSTYVRGHNESTDYQVFSPQIETMNWVFMLQDVFAAKSNYWFEISVWDGGKTKREDYKDRDQNFTPDRYQGMVQFEMWLLRPKVVREFRYYNEKLAGNKEYFEKILDSVDCVYNDPYLRNAWQTGKLVPNNSREHPYNYNIPNEYKNRSRWFLLNTNVNNTDYKNSKSEINVFSLALEVMVGKKREWVVYTYSPLNEYKMVSITIPGYGEVKVDTKPAGSFYKIQEENKNIVETVGVCK